MVVKEVEFVKGKELGGLLLKKEKWEETREVKVRDLVCKGDGGREEEARIGWAGDWFREGDRVGLQERDGGEACGTSSERLKGRNGGKQRRKRSGGLEDWRIGRSRWVCRGLTIKE